MHFTRFGATLTYAAILLQRNCQHGKDHHQKSGTSHDNLLDGRGSGGEPLRRAPKVYLIG